MELSVNKRLRSLSRAITCYLLLILMLLAAGCATSPRHDKRVTQTTGIASWYGRKFHGKTTASGEKYNMNKMTAAHRTLPFGTRVKVTHLGNKRTVTVRINDRGPFIDGRIIDLSYKAASKLAMIDEGIAKVHIEVLD